MENVFNKNQPFILSFFILALGEEISSWKSILSIQKIKLALILWCLGEENDEDDGEDEKDSEDLDHEPTILRDVVEVLHQLGVGHVDVQRRVLHVRVDSENSIK